MGEMYRRFMTGSRICVEHHKIPVFTAKTDIRGYPPCLSFLPIGKAKLKIPGGSQTGQVFKLKGQGVPHLRGGGRGDQLVTLFVATPDSLTKKQRQLLEELGESLGEKNMPKPKKWQGFSERD